MNDALESLLASAIRAPSGDNMQPWRFDVDHGSGRITFLVDETRDPSPMNAGQRMSRIAVGAALENFLRTAHRSGWVTHLEEPKAPAVAVVRVEVIPGSAGAAEKIVADRVTNRRPYDGRPVGEDVLARLKHETPELEGVTTQWVVGRERLAPLADLIGRSDATMFGESLVRKAILANVRFDAPPEAEVEEGLSLASLELSPGDRRALKLMPSLPNWLLRLAGAARLFAATARRLVESASGLCLVVAQDSAPRTDLTVGRAVQRAWLTLTAEGLAAQPMTSLAVLDNVLEHGSAELIACLGRDRLTNLLGELRKLAPEIGGGRPAFLLRFGFAPPPSGRTGRLPLPAVVSWHQ
jgi:nitroreductase